MLVFKSRKHEEAFQKSYARQHIVGDFLMYVVGFVASMAALYNIWCYKHNRSLLWHCIFLPVYIVKQVSREPLPFSFVVVMNINSHARSMIHCIFLYLSEAAFTKE
jgi:hypothetical protein